MLTLKDKPLSGVLYSTTLAEVWKKLSEWYLGKESNQLHTLSVNSFDVAESQCPEDDWPATQ